MLAPPPALNYFKCYFNSHIVWALAVLVLFFSACGSNAEQDEYSPKVKALFDTVQNYTSYKRNGVAIPSYVDSVFRGISNPTVYDRFSYYRYHYVYLERGIHAPGKALPYADSMLMMAKKSVSKHKYVANYAEASFAAGDAYFSLSQYSEAYKHFYEGYYVGKSEINNAILSEYTYRMGMVMFKQAHYLEAASYFKISFDYSRGYKDEFKAFYQRQELLDNIGESYKNSGKLDSASIYLAKTLELINANEKRFSKLSYLLETARGVVYGNQGDVALLTNNFAVAEDLLKKSIVINLKKGNDNKDAELTEIKLARLYLYLKRTDDFHALLTEVRGQLDSISNSEAETSWNYLMSRYYDQKKDSKNALAHLKKYTILKDSVIKLNNSLKRTDVTTQQANYDKQSEIDNLKDYNKRQLIYIYVAVLLSIMAVVIIFLVVRNLRRSRRDVANIKALNDKINSQKQNLVTTLNELNQSSREKDRILRAVAHDLRNPLGGIASLSGAMMADDYTSDQLEMIELIKDTSYNSLELINEILEAANTATTHFNKEFVDINALLSNSVELLRFKAADKKQIISLDLDSEIPTLFVSREKIWRVISNLISNAIKFSHHGGEITVGLRNYQNGVEITVKDAGIGIPENLKQGVFNMFTDAKRAGTDGEKSFGLGLSICQQIVEKHNGKIWFQSDAGVGTTFYVFLPFEAETVSLEAAF
jgi:two-component system sensor histidine kinase VicK